MTTILASFLRDERGAVQLEYSIMAALVGAVTVLGLGALGDAMDGMYRPILHSSGGGQSHELPSAVTH
jgi:Flp pilus assembly pilin Flp